MNRIKKTFICRSIDEYTVNTKLVSSYKPKFGDVAVFEVLSIGKHTNVQGAEKRNINIYPGDFIMAAFGTRYATEQFEGYLPTEPTLVMDILGAGGTVGVMKSTHAKFNSVGTTRVRLVGYVMVKENQIANTITLNQHNKLAYSGAFQSTTRVILSIGSSMDSGKTTTAANMVKGIKSTGRSVGFIKLTGTVYSKDSDLNYDNGADVVADFGDMGYPSTFNVRPEEILDIYESLMAKVQANNLDYVVMEIADGIFQQETEALLQHRKFMSGIDSIVFSAGDSLSAVQGVRALQEMNIIPSILSGVFTASPLLMQEVAQKVHTAILPKEELAKGNFLSYIEAPLKEFA